MKKNDIEKLKKLYKNTSKTNEEIAKILNVSSNTVIRYVKKLGIRRTKEEQKAIKEQRTIDKIDIVKLKKLLNQYSMEDVSKKIGICRGTISKIKKKFNIIISDEIRNKNMLKKQKQTILEKYGVEHSSKSPIVKRKMEETFLRKYGYKNPSQSEIIKKKKEITNLKKRGVKCSFQDEEVKNKIKKVLNEKYGADNYNKSLNYKKRQNEILQKIKQTNLERYGVEYASQNKVIIDKIIQTNLERYGCENVFQNKNIMEKIKNTFRNKYNTDNYFQYMKLHPELYNNKWDNSKPNRDFAKLLKKYKIKYDREYPLLNRSYDFILPDYKMLIEINPYATHNSSWHPFSKYKEPLPQNYHYLKTKFANDNGFKCICIWDWDDPEKIVKAIKNGKLKIIKTNIKLFYYNAKENKVYSTKIKELNRFFVKIYNDGQKIIY